MRLALISALALSLVGTAAPAVAQKPADTLAMTFTGIEVPKGKIMIALYDSEAGWAAGKAVRVAAIDVTAKDDVSMQFVGLAPGHYGVKAFHDVNGDGTMNTNPFGMPTEPFAFSNDAPANAGPAKWAAASFDVAAGTTSQRITIR